MIYSLSLLLRLVSLRCLWGMSGVAKAVDGLAVGVEHLSELGEVRSAAGGRDVVVKLALL